MTQKIHPTAIVSATAQIADNVEIGPYSIIGEDVKIGEGTKIMAHVVIEGDTTIGKNNVIFPFAVIGTAPQDLKFKGEKAKLVIGDNNKIREHVTIHLGTQDGAMVTTVGSNCLFSQQRYARRSC